MREIKKPTPSPPLLSTHPYYMLGKSRQYKALKTQEVQETLKRTKWSLQELKEESEVNENELTKKGKQNSGSLWSSDGQGAYLFSENNLKKVGDPITVVLNGSPRKQLSKKKKVIQSLLLNKKEGQFVSSSLQKESSDQNEQDSSLQSTNTQEKRALSSHLSSNFDVLGIEFVSTKIVEKISQERYRIEGCQIFLIGKKQYCLIVMGIVRSQDLLENRIQATSLIDGYFDILKFKKNKNSLENMYL